MQTQKIKNISFFEIFKYFIFFIIFALFHNINIVYGLKPFAFAFLFALVWCNQKPLVLAPLYLLSSVFQGITFINLVPVLFTSVMLIIFSTLHFTLKKPFNIYLLTAYAVLSQAGLFFVTAVKTVAVINLLSIVIGVIYMLAIINFLQALLLRKLKFKLNADEIICGCVLLLSIASALSILSVFNVPILVAFSVFLILTVGTVSNNAADSLVVAVVCGLGLTLTMATFNYVAAFCILSVFSAMFIKSGKIYAGISVLLVDAVLGFYFEIYGANYIYNLIATAIGAGAFLLVRSKTIENLKYIFTKAKGESSAKNLINITKQTEFYRLNEVAEMFNEMDKVFKSMVKKNLTKEQARFMLAKELSGRMCEDCPNKKICYRSNGEDMLNHFDFLMEAGIIKGKVNVTNATPFMTNKCNKLNVVLNIANDLLSRYLEYDSMITNVNSSKVLVSDQLASVSKAIKSLADEIKKPLIYNENLEKQILQNLIYSNFISVDNVIVTESAKHLNVILTLKENLINEEIVISIISKTCKMKMEIKQIITNQTPGEICIYLTNAPKCDIVFGSSSLNKDNQVISGDTHSIIKLSTGKYMFALCDGMGSGKSANEVSTKAIGLIENFYKAGFDSQAIIENVNKIFLSGYSDRFSAVDVCVLDLNNLIADFIKLGAPFGFIKREKETEVINAGALPMGVLEEAVPVLEKKLISPKDTIFLMTDGVSDSFNNIDDLKDYINSLKGSNPQELADNILKMAASKNGGKIKDDMTVFVARVFSK